MTARSGLEREAIKLRKKEQRFKLRTERLRMYAKQRRERRCFWVWPWGHAWTYDCQPPSGVWHCVGCGKTR